MELRQLQYLVDVTDEASFTKAAAKAHVAQPGVSAQVRRLEKELGHVLLDRTGGTVRPTEAGAAILPYARAVLGAIAGMRQTADALTGLVRGHLTVGMVASISTPRVDLPGLLASFYREHPGIEITLTEAVTDQLLAALLAGGADIAFVGLGPEPLPAGIETLVLASEPLVVAVSPGHPLAGQENVTLDALRAHSLITLPAGTGLRAHVDAACAAAGFRPRIAFEAGDPRLLARLAGQGLGAAILPASAAGANPLLHVLALTQPSIQGRIALAWRASNPASPATRAFLRHATRALTPPP
jgi:DNA-binding transcriptional LysR family regulator